MVDIIGVITKPFRGGGGSGGSSSSSSSFDPIKDFEDKISQAKKTLKKISNAKEDFDAAQTALNNAIDDYSFVITKFSLTADLSACINSTEKLSASGDITFGKKTKEPFSIDIQFNSTKFASSVETALESTVSTFLQDNKIP